MVWMAIALLSLILGDDDGKSKENTKPNPTAVLEKKLKELDQLYRTASKEIAKAKTSADRDDTVKKHQEVLTNWAEGLEGI